MKIKTTKTAAEASNEIRTEIETLLAEVSVGIGFYAAAERNGTTTWGRVRTLERVKTNILNAGFAMATAKN